MLEVRGQLAFRGLPGRRRGCLERGPGIREVTLQLGLRRVVLMARVPHGAVFVIHDLAQSQRRLRWSLTVPPESGAWLEPVVAQQTPPVLRHETHSLDDVGEDRLRDEVVEVHPDPTGLDALAPLGDLPVELPGLVQ